MVDRNGRKVSATGYVRMPECQAHRIFKILRLARVSVIVDYDNGYDYKYEARVWEKDFEYLSKDEAMIFMLEK